MLEIHEKTKCCGCGACKNICPSNCISMQLDAEGFMYPIIDHARCIDCDLCNKVCPIINSFTKNDGNSCSFYGAYNNDKNINRDSSSGGIFWLLVQYVISNEGIVYGVALQENFRVVHSRAETLENCVPFRKSKYLQSDTTNIYKQAKKDLDNGRMVLFSGSPCQIAGLYSYLQKDYNNLISCDVVCHGVPSRAVFNKYIDELNHKMHDTAVSICWRDKRFGWNPNRISIQFKSGREIITTSLENQYQKGFLSNLYLRPSCYKCPFAKLPRIGDISLADFWRYEGSLQQGNENNGLSIIIISTSKGKLIFDKIKKNCTVETVAKEYVTRKSRHVYTHPTCNKNRDAFFRDFQEKKFNALYRKYIKPKKKPILFRIKRFIASKIR